MGRLSNGRNERRCQCINTSYLVLSLSAMNEHVAADDVREQRMVKASERWPTSPNVIPISASFQELLFMSSSLNRGHWWCHNSRLLLRRIKSSLWASPVMKLTPQNEKQCTTLLYKHLGPCYIIGMKLLKHNPWRWGEMGGGGGGGRVHSRAGSKAMNFFFSVNMSHQPNLEVWRRHFTRQHATKCLNDWRTRNFRWIWEWVTTPPLPLPSLTMAGSLIERILQREGGVKGEKCLWRTRKSYGGNLSAYLLFRHISWQVVRSEIDRRLARTINISYWNKHDGICLWVCISSDIGTGWFCRSGCDQAHWLCRDGESSPEVLGGPHKSETTPHMTQSVLHSSQRPSFILPFLLPSAVPNPPSVSLSSAPTLPSFLPSSDFRGWRVRLWAAIHPHHCREKGQRERRVRLRKETVDFQWYLNLFYHSIFFKSHFSPQWTLWCHLACPSW